MSIWIESVKNLCPICAFPVDDKKYTKKEASQIECFFFVYDRLRNILIASLTLFATSGVMVSSVSCCTSITLFEF